VTGWKAWLDVPASERGEREQALEPLAEEGFVVTSRELARDGPWRIEIYGEGAKPVLDGTWQWQALPDKDWVAENQRSFKSFAVGPFWVHPSHDKGEPPAGAISLRIDAGMAFGTGMHATTRGCLELLATLDPSQATGAVDVGCGSGILAIAMAKLWQRPVLAGDNDTQAVTVAVENARLNGVGKLCRFFISIGLEAPELTAGMPYDLIVANILADPLIELSESFAAAVRPGGRALLSGLLAEQADMVMSVYSRRGFTVKRHVDLETGGACWRSLLLRKG
jgi:ribosomal protein L11 methyltransferase